jgi:hypothetical protein
MPFQIDTSIHWTEHYVEHGFCVIKRAVPQTFCDSVIAVLQDAFETTRPPAEWNTETIQSPVLETLRKTNMQSPELRTALESVYDEPAFVDILESMLAPGSKWNGIRAAGCFLRLQDPANKPENPELAPYGHLDFVDRHIPLFGDGFTCQVSLVKSEPFSGNTSIYPGWHKIVQKHLLENPDFQFAPSRQEEWRAIVPQVEPFEFVADPGDVMLFHHLVGHEINMNYSRSGVPRTVIHCLAAGDVWLNSIDPATRDLSPWMRSSAHNGKIDLAYDDQKKTVASARERNERRARKKQNHKTE